VGLEHNCVGLTLLNVEVDASREFTRQYHVLPYSKVTVQYSIVLFFPRVFKGRYLLCRLVLGLKLVLSSD
jgi:hypothetical protein